MQQQQRICYLVALSTLRQPVSAESCAPCLFAQMEDFEAELESLESNNKRSKKPPARVAHYRESLDRCAWAVGKAEAASGDREQPLPET